MPLDAARTRAQVLGQGVVAPTEARNGAVTARPSTPDNTGASERRPPYWSDSPVLTIRMLTPNEAAIENERKMREYEARYGMSSADFYEQYKAGQMPDCFEMSDWAGLCYVMADNSMP